MSPKTSTWGSSSCNDKSIILAMQERLEKMAGLVKENKQDAQKKRNIRYDGHATLHTFTPGDSVAAITHHDQQVFRQMARTISYSNDATYAMDIIGRQKQRIVFHVSMLKQ